MEGVVDAEGFEVGGGDGAAGVVGGGGRALGVLGGWLEEEEEAYGEVVVDPGFHFGCCLRWWMSGARIRRMGFAMAGGARGGVLHAIATGRGVSRVRLDDVVNSLAFAMGSRAPHYRTV